MGENNEKIKDSLQKKFNEPLKEFSERRIIFWEDPEGDYKDMVAE